MPRASTIAAGVALLMLGGALAAPVASARPARRSCVDIQVQRKRSTLLATHIRTDYACSYARKKLSGLLHDGVGRIPRPRAGSGRWGGIFGTTAWTCRRYRGAGRQVRRIRFVLTVQIGKVGPPPGPPVPVANPLQLCVDLWNGDPVNKALIGYHFYNHHMIRRLWAFQLPSGRCAFIGVVPPDDAEYGNDGEVSVPGGGWAFMTDVPELGDAKAIQGQAPASANVTLSSDGSVALD